MVDVGDKAATSVRRSRPVASRCRPKRWTLIRDGTANKGDVLAVARVAGIMAAKRTERTDPALPPAAVDSKVTIDLDVDGHRRHRHRHLAPRPARPASRWKRSPPSTVALLTIYDMVKAVDKAMTIDGVRLLTKTRRQVGRLGRGVSPFNALSPWEGLGEGLSTSGTAKAPPPKSSPGRGSSQNHLLPPRRRPGPSCNVCGNLLRTSLNWTPARAGVVAW